MDRLEHFDPVGKGDLFSRHLLYVPTLDRFWGSEGEPDTSE